MPRSDYDSDDAYFSSLNSDEPDYEAMAEARAHRRGDYASRDERSYERYVTGD